jgi:hypothetical protein
MKSVLESLRKVRLDEEFGPQLRKDAIPLVPFGKSLTPYFCVEDFFSNSLLDLCQKYWPEERVYTPVYATPGSFEVTLNIYDVFQESLKSKMTNEQVLFWMQFTEQVVKPTILSCNSRLLPVLQSRYADYLDKTMINTCSIRMVNSDYVGLDRHVHYYHDPIWLYSFFFYIDDDNRGLSLYQYDIDRASTVTQMIEATSHIVSPRYEGDRQERLKLEDKIKFKRNSLFVFRNSPSSWHGVGPFAKTQGGWGRRHIVTHVMLPRHLISDIYGVPEENWTYIYTTDKSEKVMDDIRKDVSCSLNLDFW